MIKIVSAAVLLFFSCESKKTQNASQSIQYSYVEEQKKTNLQIATDTLDAKYLEAKDTAVAPIKIVRVKLTKSQYSSFRDISLTFKNVGKKDVQAVKFQWYTKNALAEPANLPSFYVRGESAGLYDELLKINKTSSVTFEKFSSDANLVIAARAYEVTFSDGTKWSLKNQSYLNISLMKNYSIY
jgi:hypothetical protein